MTHVVRSVELPNGVTIPYAVQGDPTGVPMVLLHAVADSWRSLERVLPHLPHSIRAYVPTQRGHGDTSHYPDGYHPRDFASDLAAFMDVLDVQGAVVVGGSSGGFVARRFALDHPEHTLGLALLGSPATLRDKPSALEMWDTVSNLTDPIDPEFVRAFAASTLAQPVPQDFVDAMVRENLKVPARVWQATVEGIMQDDSFGELHQITVPALIIWGDRDAFLSRDDQNTLAAAIPGSRLLVYPGAGHAVYWEEPERIARDLASFVEGLPGL